MYTEKHCNFSNIVYSILNSLTVINERDLFKFDFPEYDFSTDVICLDVVYLVYDLNYHAGAAWNIGKDLKMGD
jgi:hypothetical protein